MGKENSIFPRIAAAVNDDAGLVRRGRFIDLEFLLSIGKEANYLAISKGRVVSVSPGDVLMRPWTFAIHIDGEAWDGFCQATPRPGHHDLFAMTKSGQARIEGDIHPLMANLRYFKELLAKGRDGANVEADHGG